jgi:hypothetical protein
MGPEVEFCMDLLYVLTSLPVWLEAAITFAFTYSLATLAYLLSRCIISASWFRPIQVNMVQTSSVILALLMAFLATHVWRDLSDARACVATEVHALKRIQTYVCLLPEEQGRRIRQLADDYVRMVAEAEWNELAHGRHSVQAADALDELMVSARKLDTQSEQDRTVQRSLLEAINTTASAREDRLHISKDIITPFTWGALYIVAFMVLLTTSLVHYQEKQSQMIALVMYSTIAAVMFLLILSHDQPFAHEDMLISPKRYMELIR